MIKKTGPMAPGCTVRNNFILAPASQLRLILFLSELPFYPLPPYTLGKKEYQVRLESSFFLQATVLTL